MGLKPTLLIVDELEIGILKEQIALAEKLEVAQTQTFVMLEDRRCMLAKHLPKRERGKGARRRGKWSRWHG